MFYEETKHVTIHANIPFSFVRKETSSKIHLPRATPSCQIASIFNFNTIVEVHGSIKHDWENLTDWVSRKNGEWSCVDCFSFFSLYYFSIFRLSSFDFRLSTLDFQLSAIGIRHYFGFRTSDFGYRSSDFGLQTSGFGLQTPDSGLCTFIFFWTSALGLRTSDIRLRISVFELRTSDFGLRT